MSTLASTFGDSVLGSTIASLGTTVGALPVLAIRSVSRRLEDVLLSAAAGIMLAATAFSLVQPGLEVGRGLFGPGAWGAMPVAVGMALGAVFLAVVHRFSPHEHLIKGFDTAATARLKRAWLFVIAITIHNFPEGLAVGVGFGESIGGGVALALGILIQNIPEGFVVALALATQGYRKSSAVLIACATGFVEVFGGLVGGLAISAGISALPYAMGFAAGAMLFVVSHEIIPETHRNGFELDATFGLIGGFAGALLLNAWLS